MPIFSCARVPRGRRGGRRDKLLIRGPGPTRARPAPSGDATARYRTCFTRLSSTRDCSTSLIAWGGEGSMQGRHGGPHSRSETTALEACPSGWEEGGARATDVSWSTQVQRMGPRAHAATCAGLTCRMTPFLDPSFSTSLSTNTSPLSWKICGQRGASGRWRACAAVGGLGWSPSPSSRCCCAAAPPPRCAPASRPR